METDEKVLDNAPIEIVLGGDTFMFPEPKNRRRRALLREANEAANKDLLGFKEGDEPTKEQASAMLIQLDEMEDFLFLALRLTDDQSEALDPTEDEIIFGFGQVAKRLANPLVTRLKKLKTKAAK